MKRALQVKMLILTLGIVATSALASQSLSPSITGVQFLRLGPSRMDAFRHPVALAVDAQRGILVVGDTGNQRLLVFDHKGRYRGSTSYITDHERGTKGSPLALDLDSRGRMFVIDGSSGQIEVMNARGLHIDYLPSFVPEGIGVSRPRDISISKNGICILYSGDFPGFAILDPRGRLIQRVGFNAASSDALDGPSGIAMNAAGTKIAVVDAKARKSVKVYDSSGTLLAAFGKKGEGREDLSTPVGITWGPLGNLWVVDTIRHSISVFTDHGRFLGLIGGFGFEPGQFYYPVACAFLSGNQLAVLERAGARLQLLEIDVPGAVVASHSLEHNPDSGIAGVGFTIPDLLESEHSR